MDIRHEIRTIIKEVFDDEYSEEYFTAKLPDDIKKHSISYEGRKVVWYGDPDQMIVVNKDNIHGMWGNEYDQEKMNSIVNLYNNHPEKIEIECSYGAGDVINIIDIVEEQNARIQGRFEVDYEGKENAASTGNQELDDYAGTEEVDEQKFVSYNNSSEVQEFFGNHKLDVLYEKNTPEQLTQLFESINPSEEDIEAFDEFLRLETELAEAKNNKSGDFDKFRVQLRDGHHRVMGAIKAGEENVCLNLMIEDIEKLKGYYNKV